MTTVERARRLLRRMRPEEASALAFVGLVWAILASRGLPFSVGSLLGYYALFLGSIAAMSLAPWIMVRLYRTWRRLPSPQSTARDIAGLARGLALLLVVLIAYTNLKSRIFVLHPTLFDRELARIDDFVHLGGADFRAWLLSTTWSSLRMAVLDLLYFYAWVPLALPFAIAFARRGAPVARRFLGALALAYLVGSLLYLAFPAVGPAFFERERFAHLGNFNGYRMQQTMLGELRLIAARPESPAVAFFGVAAFPSLHVASTMLGVLAAWRWCRPVLILLIPLNLAVAWSALVWGWHYAIDLYAGALLAWGTWRLMTYWAGVERSPDRVAVEAAAET